MKFKLIAIGLVAILAVLLMACATDKPGTVGWEVPIENFMNLPNHSDEIEVPVGDTLILKLGSNPTTGFEWGEEAGISDTDVLKQTDYEFVEPGTDLVGAAGQEIWKFEALKRGTATVSMEYSRPWEGGEKGEWTYELTVTVN